MAKISINGIKIGESAISVISEIIRKYQYQSINDGGENIESENVSASAIISRKRQAAAAARSKINDEMA